MSKEYHLTPDQSAFVHLVNSAFAGIDFSIDLAVNPPAGVKKIGKNAFSGCKKLKTINIKTSNLTKKGIGSGCFKGIDAKATFKVPKKMKKDYEKWLVKTGKAPKKAKFK